MTLKAIKIFSILFVFTLSFTLLKAQDGPTLLKNMDNLMGKADDKQGSVQIIGIDKNGKEKVREAEMKQKKPGYRLYRYTSENGIATLSEPDGTVWMYMPAFGKPKKITMLANSQAFSGTDFSLEDMSPKPYSERYTPVLTETGVKSYTLELTPISEKSAYSKIILTLDKEVFFPHQMDYYDKKDRKFKVATYKYEKVGDYWHAKEVIMTDLKKQHQTKILVTDVVFDQGIPDSAFDVEMLVPEEKRQ